MSELKMIPFLVGHSGPHDDSSRAGCDRQISEKFQFFQSILQKNIEFSMQISENFDFFRQLKKIDFPMKKISIYSYLWPNYSISFQK